MHNDIYALVDWVKTHGDVAAFDRLRLRTLGEAVQEGIYWSQLTPRSRCSDEFFARAKEVATEIVGQPCPL